MKYNNILFRYNLLTNIVDISWNDETNTFSKKSKSLSIKLDFSSISLFVRFNEDEDEDEDNCDL